jgi:hypothetical protein
LADISERNHQVAQMARIYRDAFRVVVWLGESNSASSTAMNMLLAAGLGLEPLIAYRSLFTDRSISAPNTFAEFFCFFVLRLLE